MNNPAIAAYPHTHTPSTRSVSVDTASQRRFYLDEPIPEVVWPDPRDPRRTGPGFTAAGQRWLIKCVKGQRQGKPVKVAYHQLHRAEDLILEQLRPDFPDVKQPKRRIDNLTFGKAQAFQYISLLETTYQAVIRVDVDDPERLADLRDLGMPPNMLGINAGADPSHHGRFQAWWILDVPVSMTNGRAVALLRSVQAMLREATGADKSGSGDVNRSPWYRDGAYSWHLLHRRKWTLDEMKDRLVGCLSDRLKGLVDVDAEPDAGHHGDDGARVAGVYTGPRVLSSAQREAQRAGRHVGEGHFRPWRTGADGRLLRNPSVFMQVSEVARKSRIRDGVVDQMQIFAVLEELNGLIQEDWGIEGLPASELRDISRKVARYWNRRFDPHYQGRCAFYTEEGRHLGTEMTKARGDETRRRVVELLRLRFTSREISERIDRTVRRVQQIVKKLRDEATQRGLSLEAFLLKLSSRTAPTKAYARNSDFASLSTLSSDRPSESPHMTLSASSSSTPAPEKPSRRRSRRRRGPVRLL